MSSMIGQQGLLKRELAEILGCTVMELPKVFRGAHPKILMHDIDQEFAARYPDADQERIHDWLQRWKSTRHYQQRILHSRNRHNLDRQDRGSISKADREHAALMLFGWKERPTETARNQEARGIASGQ